MQGHANQRLPQVWENLLSYGCDRDIDIKYT